MSHHASVVYLALGSNIGDRAQNLRQVAINLESEIGVQVMARSKMYETQSVEGGGPDDFLNAALRIQTTLSPRQLLEVLQRIEENLGRPQPPRHGPRAIDIDILLWDSIIIDEVDLQVPHPRMHTRPFVLRPLLDVLEGGWVRESREEF